MRVLYGIAMDNGSCSHVVAVAILVDAGKNIYGIMDDHIRLDNDRRIAGVR